MTFDEAFAIIDERIAATQPPSFRAREATVTLHAAVRTVQVANQEVVEILETAEPGALPEGKRLAITVLIQTMVAAAANEIAEVTCHDAIAALETQIDREEPRDAPIHSAMFQLHAALGTARAAGGEALNIMNAAPPGALPAGKRELVGVMVRTIRGDMTGR